MSFDPDQYLRSQTAPAEPKRRREDAFDPDAYLKSTAPTAPGAQPAEEFGVGELAQMAAPAATAMTLDRPLGYNTGAIREAVEPLKNILPSTFRQYAATPAKAIADVAVPVMTGGVVPPMFASYNALQAARQVPEAISHSTDIISRYASAADKNQFKTTGIFPEEIKTYRDLNARIKKLDPDFSTKMGQILRDTRGGANKVLEFLQSAPDALIKDPVFQDRLRAFQDAMPSKLQQAGRMAAPVARTAARVAGPIGIGLDIAEAYPYLQQADIGARAAEGQFRGVRNPTRMVMAQNAPVTAPISPDQAQAILESGSARDIAAFGGEDQLTQMIRRKAAERVLGPVVPGM